MSCIVVKVRSAQTGKLCSCLEFNPNKVGIVSQTVNPLFCPRFSHNFFLWWEKKAKNESRKQTICQLRVLVEVGLFGKKITKQESNLHYEGASFRLQKKKSRRYLSDPCCRSHRQRQIRFPLVGEILYARFEESCEARPPHCSWRSLL